VGENLLVHIMEDTPTAHNCEPTSTGEDISGFNLTREELSILINRIGTGTVSYYWKVLGDESNSLCRLLDIPWSDMRMVLRKCKVLYGPNDSFRVKKFEELMTEIGCHWVTCRPKGKPEHFLRVGDNADHVAAITKPKDMYSATGGKLETLPGKGVHMPGVRTKMLKRVAENVVKASLGVAESTNRQWAEEPTDDTNNSSNKGSMTVYVNDLIEAIGKEATSAAALGDRYSYSQRSRRMMRKAIVHAIKGSVRAFVESWVERVGNEKEGLQLEECHSSPAMDQLRVSMQELPGASRLFNETPVRANTTTPALTLVTPPVDLTIDNDDDERDIDIVLSKIKEQTLLQNLLHKRLLQKNQKVLTLEHKNGRSFRVILPADSQSTKSFIDDAKKTRWVDQMLCTDVHREGMLVYLAKTVPDVYLKVAEVNNIRVQTEVLTTPQTLALGRLTGVNDTQMSKLRSYLKHIGNVDLKLSKKEVERIDRSVGLNELTPRATYNQFTLEWCTTKGTNREKKPPEDCHYWNSDLLVEVASEIDLFLFSMFLDKPGMMTVPPIDYCAPGFTDKPGIVVLFGGDHGKGACPCCVKLNLTSPQERKERNDLNYGCPIIQVASIDCSKDSYELLGNTVMPTIKAQLIQLQHSAAFLVCSAKEPDKYRKAFLLPKTLTPAEFSILNDALSFNVGGQVRTIDLTPHFDTVLDEDFSFQDLRVMKVVSNFNDLCIGDLAFLAMVIGMNNSAGAHCVHCVKGRSNFCCDPIHPQDMRTKASLRQSLNEYNRLRFKRNGEEKKNYPNYQGVNSLGLLDINPQRIIVPVLHCPMGLVDKVLTVFKDWVIEDVEELPLPSSDVRSTYRRAEETLNEAIIIEATATQANAIAGNTPESMAAVAAAKEARTIEQEERKKAKNVFDEMVKRHNARLFSLSQAFDVIFRSHNIRKECYHGGKYNGVNCIRIMEQSQGLFDEFAAKIKVNKIPEVSDEVIDNKCRQFARLFGLLDAVWSNVRGIDAGFYYQRQLR